MSQLCNQLCAADGCQLLLSCACCVPLALPAAPAPHVCAAVMVAANAGHAVSHCQVSPSNCTAAHLHSQPAHC